MQTIDRAMKVAHRLSSADTKKWMSISDLASACELPISSMHRLLASMTLHGLVVQDEVTKHYALGNKWLEYGLQLYDTMDVVSYVRPELERLMQVTEESVYFSQPAGAEALIIERIDCPSNSIRIHDQLGIRIPLNIGAANKTMLAYMSDEKTNRFVEQLVEEGERALFCEQLALIKAQGYAVSHGERTAGTTSFAAPIVTAATGLVGAISIGIVSFQLTKERERFLIHHVQQTAKTISSKIGGRV
ncbi:transcriptional regulator, IclR family [Geomicrobium sp. JCM 19037]|uniref:IclR family transcriptional regulator n=1 Tax=unclassified Geomicrobium TaxID=2628951 RepID=UPI00045F1911|nr:IclR family transcriptional regulator [Geomicrobium sp. JCM 19037]GAK05574.1 transcriptional regulator, IclR family [Geomicrobium sp. JCM 19037]